MRSVAQVTADGPQIEARNSLVVATAGSLGDAVGRVQSLDPAAHSLRTLGGAVVDEVPQRDDEVRPVIPCRAWNLAALERRDEVVDILDREERSGWRAGGGRLRVTRDGHYHPRLPEGARSFPSACRVRSSCACGARLA